jgi:hypothetical protein
MSAALQLEDFCLMDNVHGDWVADGWEGWKVSTYVWEAISPTIFLQNENSRPEKGTSEIWHSKL